MCIKISISTYLGTYWMMFEPVRVVCTHLTPGHRMVKCYYGYAIYKESFCMKINKKSIAEALGTNHIMVNSSNVSVMTNLSLNIKSNVGKNTKYFGKELDTKRVKHQKKSKKRKETNKE